jgi:hypothetical protein
MFVAGSLARFGLTGNKYRFTVHEYNYKTADIGHRFYNHTDEIVVENVCAVRYGFFCNPEVKQAKDNDGNLIARSGLPFMFSVEITKLNHDVETVRFDSAEVLLNNDVINMFDLNDVDYEARCVVWEGVDTKRRELDNKALRAQFKTKREIDFHGLKQRAAERIEYSNEAPMSCGVKFKPVTFDVIQNEEITVRIKIELVMSDGKIETIVLDDVYKREYYSRDGGFPRPIDRLDREEGYKW